MLVATRDYLDAPSDTHIPPCQKAAMAWLYSNARKVAPELKKITENPNERLYIRVKAMTCYARGMGSRSLPLLKKYALKEGRINPADTGFAETMSNEAKALVMEWCPNSRLAKQISEERSQ